MPRKRRQEPLSRSYPELAAEWETTANTPLSFDEMSPGSKRKTTWRCRKNPSHTWDARIAHRIQGVGCPYCSGRYATPETSLQVLYPDLAAEMHPILNGDLTADLVKPKGDKVIVWQCKNNTGHIWSAVVKSRVRGSGCPKCAHKVAALETSLLTLLPELAAEWHPKNHPLTPADVVPGSEKKVWWRCRKDLSHEWQAMVRNRAILGSGCHACAGQVATPASSLFAKCPLLAEEWDNERNGDLTPEQVLPHSSKKVAWRCRVDPTHRWRASISSRTYGCGCPMCAGQVATPTTSLLSFSPDLAAEWHPTANKDLTPNQVKPGSGLVVYWQCRVDPSHVWRSRIQHRANGIGCPYCSGQRATLEISLQALYPDLAAEWHPTNNGNLTPDQVRPHSNLLVSWCCRRDPSHVWKAIVDNRVAHGSGCPHCRPVIGSSLEDVFATILDQCGIAYQRQKPIGRSRVDFYLPATNTVIEIQGCYWHGCLYCGFDSELHQKKRTQDAKRHDTLRKKGYHVEEL
jgi:hypothetical protein